MLELTLLLAVALHGPLELVLPELRPALRGGRVRTSLMAMPETAMDKDDRPVPGQDEIGLTWKIG